MTHLYLPKNTQMNKNNAIEAAIYLKDGNRKYGIILENTIQNVFHFISNSNYKKFKNTKNEDYLEVVPVNLIETIDIYQK